MLLRDAVRAIRKAHGWTQREMAQELGVDFQTVQRAENAGRNLENQFEFFQKLLPYLAKNLIVPPDPKEVIQHGLDDETTTQYGKKRAVQAKKARLGPVSAGGSKGNR